MALDMFIKFVTPEVKGESRDSKHKGEIDVLAWSWGASNSGSTHTGGGGGSGKANFQDLSFTKWVDSSSPTLLTAVAKGTHYDDVLLTVRKAGGEAPVEYVVLELKEVMVTGVSTGGSGGEDRLTENITLNFAQFTFSYQPQDAKGASGAALKSSFNIAENAAT